MTNFTVSCTVGLFSAICVAASPADALVSRSWVASNGSDAALNCTRNTPCKSMQAAHDNLVAGGEINCVDNDNFGSVLITKSLTIDCGSVFYGDTLTPFIFRINAPGATVKLRNFSLNGLNTFGATGIDVQNVGALFVEHCTIIGFRINTAIGIRFSPTTNATLVVNDCVISDNRTGILVDPAAGLSTVNVQRVTMQKNSSAGLVADGTGGGPAFVSVRDSIASQSEHGFAAITSPGGAGVAMAIERSETSFNNSSGVLANGTVGVGISNSTLINNGTAVNQFNGGVVISYRNNLFFSNGADGSPAVGSLK